SQPFARTLGPNSTARVSCTSIASHTSLTRAPSNVIRCVGRETERARAIAAARTRSPELPVPRPGSVRVLARREHLIDETVFLGLLGREEEVAFDVVRDLRGLLVRVLGQSLLQPFAHPQHLGGLDLEVGGLTLTLTLHGRLVDEHTRIRQGQPLARSAGGQQHGGGRGGLPEADGLDLRLDVLHRVVDRGHRGERTAGRGDVERDVTVRILRFEDQQLGHDIVGARVVDLGAEEDHAVVEELGVRVLALEAVGRPLFELRHDVTRLGHETGGRAGIEVHRVHSLTPTHLSLTSDARVTILTMMPYSSASSAVNQWSRSLSLRICSSDLPVCWAVSSAICFFMCRISSAWILMSVAVPPMPPSGWCMRMRACGVAKRLPGVPEDSRNCPIEAAMPI